MADSHRREVVPDRWSVVEGAKIADRIFAMNGNPAILMRVTRENFAKCLAKVFELGRRYERENPDGPFVPPPIESADDEPNS